MVSTALYYHMLMIKRLILLYLLASIMPEIKAQTPTHPLDAISSAKDVPVALTRVTLIPEPGQIIEDATILIDKNKIIAAGKGLAVPKGYKIIPMHNAWVYPGFIELWTESKTLQNNITGCWNDAIHPQAIPDLNPKDSTWIRKKDQLRKAGFTTALFSPNDGIIRGNASLIHLGNQNIELLMAKHKAAMTLAFQTGGRRGGYPASLMGNIALIRQTFYDAQWYHSLSAAKTPASEFNECLEEIQIAKTAKIPFIFQAYTSNDPARIIAISNETGIPFVIKGTGREYERTQSGELGSTAYILPLNFPLPPDLKAPDAEDKASLYVLRHWAWAPSNATEMHKAGIEFAFTTDGLKDIQSWRTQLIRTVDRGLPKATALAALTTVPAKILGMQQQLGTVKSGAFANLTIFDRDMFHPDARLIETWIQGIRHPETDPDVHALTGTYIFRSEKHKDDTLLIQFQNGKYSATLNSSKQKPIKVELSRQNANVHFQYQPDSSTGYCHIQTLLQAHRIYGTGTELISGKTINWELNKIPETPKAEDPVIPDTLQLPALPYPNRAWGSYQKPIAQTWHIKNVSLWTNLEDAELLKLAGLTSDMSGGFIAKGDVILSNGKILNIGKNLNTPSGAIVIEGEGKHLSPGIIDEHSHIGIERGVNEGTQAITAEVRIGDVIRPEDLNIFRQLGGGVTTSQLLHGSANPIGGQSAIIKLRWGATAQEMIMKEAPPSIKFALGENVKQSNWGQQYTSRFPQSRPGVEQVMEDAFLRAQQYKKEKASGTIMRKDLELEAILEIIEGKRFITCHSYVQSEITMLMRLAEKYNFRVNTFTHVLEGYKITEKLKQHGASASTFSDWWAYKYEVIDAIPHNGALLTKAGVNTGFNSDDPEMGRRLNQEAAKAMKYGGLTETEALRLVTLNPAKMLKIDNYVGSLQPGKHADVVLWSHNPLSIYAKAEKTWIDGKLYYDIEQLQQLQDQMLNEKALLIRKATLAAKNGTSKEHQDIHDNDYHCDTLETETHSEANHEIHH
jgi:imidazolonepropionase-like amidohydrolase